MKKRIYFLRHGETDCNSQNLIQGRGVDAPLNALGHRQAEAFYHNYEDIPFDKIYISSLQRTYQSMLPMIECGFPYEILSGFDEMDFGVMEGQAMFDQEGTFALEKLLKQWKNDDGNAKVEGGESPVEVRERMKLALDIVLSKKEESNVAICMHGRALRVLMCHLLNQPFSKMDSYFHPNLALSIFDYDYSTNIFSPVCIADCTHLEALKIS